MYIMKYKFSHVGNVFSWSTCIWSFEVCSKLETHWNHLTHSVPNHKIDIHRFMDVLMYTLIFGINLIKYNFKDLNPHLIYIFNQ